MRIQHNIMAMNAYRNLGTNNTALSKNLEKLSSGYRINRAGDDAAGLAISEKMRAQISGLDQAQKNAQSGINLVKTAEGALTEVHDMLNRMVTLATQSANGTYEDSDRAKLQAEVNALVDEIDRIAENSNFNGTKLLDGSLDANGGTINAKDLKDFKALTVEGFGAGEPVLYHKDAASASKTSFTVDLRNIDNLNFKATEDETLEFRLSGYEGKNVVTSDGTEANAYKVSIAKDEVVTAKSMAEKLEKAIGDGTVTITAGSTDIEYNVVNNGDGTLTFTMSDKGYADASKAYNEAVVAGDETAAKSAHDVFKGNFDLNFMNDLGVTAGQTKADDTYLEHDSGFAKAYYDNKGGAVNGTTNVTEGGVVNADQLFDANFKFGTYKVEDGAGLQIGDEYYVWATTEETLNKDYASNVKVIDLTDLDADKLSTLYNKDGTTSDVAGPDNAPQNGDTNVMTEIFNRLTVAAKDNKMFSVQAQSNGFTLEITERHDYAGDADLTGAAGAAKVLRTFDSIDTKKYDSVGDTLNLQIGADAVETIGVGVSSMKAEDLGIKGLDISTAESANKAIDTIKSAIEQVSVTRGDLGAIQNRLEHTINNLGVMEENIQDAESNIRDTDIADEMMAYTKNNILIQSAQAMLAQANQVPQGVLQLMG